ncbi:MAG: DUF1553 domain-containing protein, partial [Planctomycetes bacterium]|nr:DUF1553 domain-containing protein [Planctomycetota bacterium]
IERFMHDFAPDAYERLVERLLSSPSYGERWAQHWLDLARFAETDGFEHDKVRPNAWRYRDWVIDALNADMPYNEFLALQLAGDEIRPGDPAAAIATGFVLCGPDMPDLNLQEERYNNFLNDITATVGSVTLGLQFGCAQCHAHKFDPISQHDFYRLRAFFENADLFKEKPIPTAQQLAQRKRFDLQRAEKWDALTESIQDLKKSVLKRVRKAQNQPDLKLTPAELQKHFTSDEKKRFSNLTAELANVKKQRPPALPLGRVLRESSPETKPSYLRIRGDFRRKGPVVQPAFPRIVNFTNATVRRPGVQASTSGRRTALAYWLIQPDHPLTTRVIVNRLWQNHFGTGLSASSSDFGTMGDEPTHPELLDWLATELPKNGWSLKQLHRLMLTSATYRQASRPENSRWSKERNSRAGKIWKQSTQNDPDNYLFSRAIRRRLEGEAVRDAMLSASGSLTQRRGGPGVRPPLPKELLVTLLKNQWPVTPNEIDHNRRSIYLFVRRNLRYPIFEVFDKPDTNASCPLRNRSTTAPQALMLLNSETSLTAARQLSGYLLAHAGTQTEKQIELCYLRCLSRSPTEQERKTALQFLTEDSDRLRSENRKAKELALPESMPTGTDIYAAAALTDFCLAIFNLNEFLYID